MEELATIEKMLDCRISTITNMVNDYTINKLMIQCAHIMVKSLLSGGKILSAGNGGSASQSQHFTSELMGKFHEKRKPFSAISLNSDTSLLTCVGNDYGFERVFSRQIIGIANPNDIFIAFTTSGKSRNISEALTICKSMGISTMVFTGEGHHDIDDMCDISVHIPSMDVPIIQECHMILSHILCELIELLINQERPTTCDSRTKHWEYLIEEYSKGYKYLILDRDGVINETKPNGYISDYKEFKFIKEFESYIHKLSNLYERIFITTNQAGIGKGIMSEAELTSLHDKMLLSVKEMGGKIDKIYFSTGIDDSDYMRKPNVGMAESIKKDFPEVDFKKTIVVGDSYSDRLFADRINAKFILIG